MEIRFSESFANKGKVYHAQWGLNKIFGEDIDERKVMNEQELIARFDEVWEKTLKKFIERSKPSNKEQKDAIVEKLKEISRKSKYQRQDYFNHNDEHYEFRLYGIDGVAQLQKLSGFADEYELNQLWFFSAGDKHPDWLIIKFATAKEREHFAEIAKRLNQDDENLGRELIRDFMRKFEKS
ncbi:MAG: hypothetical protein KME06_06595 [Kastovskya adunca ATA6-11-RM4]|jgi:hypothetical protein|nr:hypothetical protein [Kastovskya adunca ATA6-11-RM4]